MIDKEQIKYIKIVFLIFISSILLTNVYYYFFGLRIEYKFIKSVNEVNQSESLSYICSDERFKVEIVDWVYEYKIIDFLNENRNDYVIKNLKIDRVYPVWPDLLEKWYLYKIFYSYDLFDKYLKIKTKRVYEKSFYIKKDVKWNKCVGF